MLSVLFVLPSATFVLLVPLAPLLLVFAGLFGFSVTVLRLLCCMAIAVQVWLGRLICISWRLSSAAGWRLQPFEPKDILFSRKGRCRWLPCERFSSARWC